MLLNLYIGQTQDLRVFFIIYFFFQIVCKIYYFHIYIYIQHMFLCFFFLYEQDCLQMFIFVAYYNYYLY